MSLSILTWRVLGANQQMSKGHNKKRNVGIVYEQLVTTVSKAMVEKDQNTANKALRIIKKYFAQGTELYREFRLFNALVQTQVSSDALASRILEETKLASYKYDLSKLRSEKSSLINEINKTFDKDVFYDTPVKNYKVLATIHTLMEEWRNENSDVVKRVQYESKLQEWLMLEKDVAPIESLKTPSVNDLTVKIMRESFNKKFNDNLNEDQKQLLQTIAFGSDEAKVRRIMCEQKATALTALQKYQRQCDSKVVEYKLPNAIRILETLDTDDTSDQNIAKFMTVSRLCDELLENNNG